MIGLPSLILSIAAVFAVALAISYYSSKHLSNRMAKLEINANSVARIIGPAGAYSSHFLRTEQTRLVFSMPLQADRYEPINDSQEVLVQVPGENKLLSFQCSVVGQNTKAHEIYLSTPTVVRNVERRSEPRMAEFAGEDVMIDGNIASVVDLSAGGMRTWTPRRKYLAAESESFFRATHGKLMAGYSNLNTSKKANTPSTRQESNLKGRSQDLPSNKKNPCWDDRGLDRLSQAMLVSSPRWGGGSASS